MSDTKNTPEMSVEEYAAKLCDYIYRRTTQSKVTAKKALLLAPPFGISKQVLEDLLDGVGTDKAHPALAGIATTQGKKDLYYYDAKIMTKQYAALDALLEDKDLLNTIASVVRTDSQLYPRPTPYDKFSRSPFKFSDDEIAGAVARMKSEGQYQDIGVVTASNGKRAMFSTNSLSRQYAQSLFEMSEVSDRENP